MIIIKFHDISITTASDKSGVMIGQNFAPNWDTFSKSNTNTSGNQTSDSINILIDNDAYDFPASDSDSAQQIVIEKSSNKKKVDPPSNKSNSSSSQSNSSSNSNGSSSENTSNGNRSSSQNSDSSSSGGSSSQSSSTTSGKKVVHISTTTSNMFNGHTKKGPFIHKNKNNQKWQRKSTKPSYYIEF